PTTSADTPRQRRDPAPPTRRGWTRSACGWRVPKRRAVPSQTREDGFEEKDQQSDPYQRRRDGEQQRVLPAEERLDAQVRRDEQDGEALEKGAVRIHPRRHRIARTHAGVGFLALV